MVTGRRLLRGALAATALGWAAVGLLLGLGIVLPTPNLGLLWPNLVLDQLAAVVEGLSLWLAVFACSASPWPSRAPPGPQGSSGGGAGGGDRRALPVPVVQGWRTASQEGVALSLSEYFSFPSIRSPETVTYARPEGGAQARRPAPAGRRRHRGTGAKTGGGHGARRRWGLWRP